MQGDEPPVNATCVRPLWPPGEPRPLAGLYLEHDLRADADRAPLVYANFVASLDGRIALDDDGGVPPAIANARDWWLFQELAIQADAIMISGRHLRARALGHAQDLFVAFTDPRYAALRAWRTARGLPAWPWIVVLSRRMDFAIPAGVPPERLLVLSSEAAATSPPADALRQRGATVLAAGHDEVDARMAIDRLAARGLLAIYAVGGARMLHLLAAGGVLSHLYLTQVHRLLGGGPFTSLIEGAILGPPLDLRLHRLYYDPALPGAGGQFFGCYRTLAPDASTLIYAGGP
ncbi:hypothetical protein BI364_13150 [Acidihalobacter yilgarnensis]|uniref:Bacterial bifunctional deaminase-reductase C-terminal domain-containing protein n=1 Tax=Acidihalobacter yilgarnensis TaxID=2819280 RepID=A0A1D8IQV9_9GAMM|nr:hypothetical protein BI364_13150 [Acidihalobacter yilgarnensis]